ncbi:MAG: O-antigen ligase family protein [Rhodoglobus sp.]
MANVAVAGFNVKISIVAFALSALLAAVRMRDPANRPRIPRALLILASAIVLIMVIASLFAAQPVTALIEVATVIGTAVLPAFAVLANSRLPGQFDAMLRWLVWGALFVCAFGIYQLVAFYLGLPQFVSYTGVSGGLGRISAFSYEPAMLGYFLAGALAVALVRLWVVRSPWGYVHLAIILTTILLLNSRAVFLVLPPLLLLARPLATGLFTKKQLLGVAAAAVGVVVLAIVIAPKLPGVVVGQFLSIFDPTEAASNAPRLQLYGAALKVAQEHLWLGVGPSNFGLYIVDLDYQQYAGVSLNKMVVNNVWIQAVVDAGILLFILQLALLIYVIVFVYFSKNVVARTLMAGWIPVVLVGGMVVSNFYDSTLWVLLSLAIGAVQLGVVGGTSAPRGHSRILSGSDQSGTEPRDSFFVIPVLGESQTHPRTS